MPATTDKFKRSSDDGEIPVVASVQNPRSTGGSTLTIDTQLFWPVTTGICFSTYKVDANQKKIDGTQTDWVGVSNGSNTISSVVRTGGEPDSGNAIGDKVQMVITAQWAKDLIDGLLAQHKQDGSHKDISADSVAATGAVSGATVSASGQVSGASANFAGTTQTGKIQVASATTATIDGSGNITPSAHVYTVTALGADAAIQVPSFTPWHGAPVVLQIWGAALHNITFAAGYANVSGLDTPTATVASKWLTIGMMYNSGVSKWHILSISQEA